MHQRFKPLDHFLGIKKNAAEERLQNLENAVRDIIKCVDEYKCLKCGALYDEFRPQCLTCKEPKVRISGFRLSDRSASKACKRLSSDWNLTIRHLKDILNKGVESRKESLKSQRKICKNIQNIADEANNMVWTLRWDR